MFANKNKEIGERIKSARKKMNMSQYTLYQKTGISTTQISAYENGNKSIGLSTLDKIAIALNTSIDYLYNGSLESRPVNSSKNIGELVVNCINALYEEGVIAFLPNAKDENLYSNEYIYEVVFSKYKNIIDDLIEKLDDFKKNHDNYPDPDGFKEQLLASAAKQINGSMRKN